MFTSEELPSEHRHWPGKVPLGANVLVMGVVYAPRPSIFVVMKFSLDFYNGLSLVSLLFWAVRYRSRSRKSS
jgi:hypothetical protein